MIHQLFDLIFSNLSLSLFCLAVLIAAYDCRQKQKKWIVPSLWFKWLAMLVFGLVGIYGFFMHGFMADVTAKAYGLKPSPFQMELALCNLAFGILGLLCYRNDFSFRRATTLTACIYWLGSFVMQSAQMIKMQKFSLPYSLTWYAMDLALPVLLLLFLFLSKKESCTKKNFWFR